VAIAKTVGKMKPVSSFLDAVKGRP